MAQRYAFGCRCIVAGIAVNFFMCAVKFEFGLFVVIKLPYLPAIGVVALLAANAEA